MAPDVGGCTLLLASSGGHLSELHLLRNRLAPDLGRVEWATFDSPQASDLLYGDIVHHIPPVRPKDARGALRNVRVATQLLSARAVSRVISTGAGVAMPYALAARRAGIPFHYIESAARTEGPSLTGQILSLFRGPVLYSQHRWDADHDRWHNRGSVFDAYSSRESEPILPEKIVVTFGTQASYGFRRAAVSLHEALQELAPTASVLWQVGGTDTSEIGIDVHRSLSHATLDSAIGEADLVVAHAGVGSSLMCLARGKIPVLIPRRRVHGEHTDDHQVQIAAHLAGRGLAVHAEAEDLTVEHLMQAMRRHAVTASPPPFVLDPGVSR